MAALFHIAGLLAVLQGELPCSGPWGGYPAEGRCNYREGQWAAFVDTLKGHPAVAIAAVGRSTGGRVIPMLRIGPPRGHRALVYWQARQHCREWKTNYALEGAVRWALSEDPQAAWLRRHVRLIVVPFVNIDRCEVNGVDRGDDGHTDLNRVWPLEAPALANPGVAGIQALLRRETRAALPAAIIDWHSPNRDGGGGAGREHVFVTGNTSLENRQRTASLVELIRGQASSGQLVSHHTVDNPSKPGTFKAWASGLPGVRASITAELKENTITADEARGLGRDVMAGTARWLREHHGGTATAGQMHFPGRDWVKVAPAQEAVDGVALKRALDHLAKNAGRDGVDELMVVRNGRVIWAGPHVGRVHGVWSITKSFTTTALGLLIEDGKARLDTRAVELLPAMAAHYPAVTLRHLATMTSGYAAVGDEPRPDGYRHGPSLTPFLPARPRFAPGARFEYWDSAMNQLAHALTVGAREPLAQLFQRRIAEPVGMDPAEWRWGEQGDAVGVPVNSGAGNHDRHVQISARQLARFGHLLLNRGRWRDRQLVPASWVDEATRGQLGPAADADVYGYGFWVNGLGRDGQRRWPGAPENTFAASGYNNNDLFVIPEWRMVIVRLGQDQKQRQITDAAHGEFLRLVGESLRDPPDAQVRTCTGRWGSYPSNGRCNYRLPQWSAFVDQVKSNEEVTVSTLTRSTKGAPIPLLQVGPRQNHRALVYWQARQHCREWKTNYALEGAVRWALSADPQARWMRRNVRFVVVPWVNYDKCATNSPDRGDDGHDDLNRVWLLEPPALANPAVAAIKDLLRAQTRPDLPAVAFDWHSPNRDGGGGAGFLHGFQTWNSPDENKRRSEALVEVIRRHATSRNVVHHDGKDNATKPGMFNVWAPSLPGMKSVLTAEMRENSLSAEDARGLGKDALVGIIRWLREAHLQASASR